MSRPLRLLLVLVALAALAGGAWYVVRVRGNAAAVAPGPPDTLATGMRAATLWFAAESGDSLVSEVRELPEQDDLHGRLAQLVDALVAGPATRGVGVLPAGTTLLHAYLDDRGLLTLDLSRAFQQGFRGGSREEDLVTGSLLRTIGSNVPEAREVLIACGGAPLASLGGHLPLDQPLDPRTVP